MRSFATTLDVDLRLLLLASALCVVRVCAADAHGDALVGWATVEGGTRGGEGGLEFDAHSATQLVELMKSNQPKLIRIASVIKLPDMLRVSSNTTLLGIGDQARLVGGGLHIRKASNVVVRNLAISQAPDAISIEESQHVWVDHCDLSECRDGLLDIKRGSDFITVSWNHFHNHHKTCLLGHSDKADIRQVDMGHLRVTYHHNYFDGTQTRHPRVRFAQGVHVFNNYFRGNEYGVASLMDAGVIVEGNVFEDVERPTLTAYGDSPDPGRLVARDNLLIRSGTIETSGDVDASLLAYSYALDPVASIQQIVRSQTRTAKSQPIARP
jgi:pectate lyase